MKVFISYAREEREFVHALHAALLGRNCDVWVDWEDILPTATWLAEVYAGIEAADAFLFVISPASAASDTCRREIAHAAKHNKRLISIVRGEMDPRGVPDAVSALNWIYFRPTDDFDAAVQTLMQALDTDMDWVHTHTRLLVRALDWDKRSRDQSLLLRGRDLRDAETALASAPAARPPAPTPMQMQYVLLSRQTADRRRRAMIGAIGLGVTTAAVLGYAAWSFSRERDVQRTIAAANALTTQAQLVRDRGANMLPVSLLLALESKRIAPSAEADQLIRQGLSILARPLGRLHHAHALTALNFSPDGRLLATAASDDADVHIWDLATQREVRTLRHSGDLADNISAVAFTPDGASLVTGGLEGATVWEVGSDRNRRLAAGESLDALAISPDGRYLATGDHDGAVVVRDLATGQRVLEGRHDMIVNAVAWSPDGRFLASASNDKTARVWQVPGGEVLSLPHESGPVGVAWSPDGTLIATGGWEGRVRVWERESGRERTRFGVQSVIQAVAFSADGTHLIAAAADQTARVWDMTSGTESARMTHGGGVTALAVSPDGRYVATGSEDRTAALWDLGGAGDATRLAHPEGIVTAVAYSPDGRRLATVCDRSVHVWGLPGGAAIARLDHADRVRAVMFSADGRALLTVADDSSGGTDTALIAAWDATSGRRERQFPVRDTVVGFSRDGDYFASANSREGVLVRDVESGTAAVRISQDVVDHPTSAVALSPDRRYVAASVIAPDTPGRTYVWQTEGGALRCRLDHGGYVMGLTFSPDGQSLAVGGQDNTARVWALDGCRETARISLADEILAVAFSPDGTLLATGSRDRTARVWALASRKELTRLVFGGVVSGVAFSPDGRFVAAASSDRTARVWAWRSDEDAAAAVCSRVGRSLTADEWRTYVGDGAYHETCAGLTAPAPGEPSRIPMGLRSGPLPAGSSTSASSARSAER